MTTDTIDPPSLADQRAAASAALADLEIEQGRAWLDNLPFDPSRIDALHVEIAAIDAADAEQSRRDREAAALLTAADRAQARKEARTALAAYDAAMIRAEEAAKSLAVEIGVVQARSRELEKLTIRMGFRPPVALDGRNITSELSRLVAGELRPAGRMCGFGDISFPSVPKPDWAMVAARVPTALNPLIGE